MIFQAPHAIVHQMKTFLGRSALYEGHMLLDTVPANETDEGIRFHVVIRNLLNHPAMSLGHETFSIDNSLLQEFPEVLIPAVSFLRTELGREVSSQHLHYRSPKGVNWGVWSQVGVVHGRSVICDGHETLFKGWKARGCSEPLMVLYGVPI